MLRLITPCLRYLPSYTDAYDEYTGKEVLVFPFTNPRACDLLEKYDRYRRADHLPSNRVGADTYWLVDDERDYFIGEISIRHTLTPALERLGGHIGYGIRYSEWGRGYGTLMLRLALDKARERGLERVLITCHDANLASARVMEKNGAVLQDTIENESNGHRFLTRRYWIML